MTLTLVAIGISTACVVVLRSSDELGPTFYDHNRIRSEWMDLGG